MNKIVFTAIFLLGWVPFSFSETEGPSGFLYPYDGMVIDDSMKEKSIHVQEMRKSKPAAYREMMQAEERERQISGILSRLKAGKISQTVARKKVGYLMNGTLEKRLLQIDRELEEAQKRVDYLRRVKRNPELLIDEEMNRRTGTFPVPFDRLFPSEEGG